MSHFTLSDIQRLHAQGKIRGYKASGRPKPQAGGRLMTKYFPKRDSAKDWIAWNLAYWCNQHAVILQAEYKFHPERKWRFDYAIEALKIGIEYEGLNSEKSRHTTLKGYTGDTEKYNEAQRLGWRVLRYTALNYKSLLTDLNKMTNGAN